MIEHIALTIISIYCVVKIWQILTDRIYITVEVKNETPQEPSTKSECIVGTTKWQPLTKRSTHNEFTPDDEFETLTSDELEQESESLATMGLNPDQQAQGVSFSELGEAVNIAKKRNPTHAEKSRFAEVFAKIEESDLDHQLRCGDKVLNQHITRLLDERMARYNRQQNQGVTVAKPAGVDNFDISDFV
ncbi:MAG: hypothetical protein R3Y68_08905 [Rikenellaceae bacterium]